MKIRIKFSKMGSLKYIGHLDTMRFFQKIMKRAGIPIAYSNGMSPHQIMSFALPLGIGDESEGEYLDIELTESVEKNDAINSLNNASVPGIKILSFKVLPDNALNAMASVEAADYKVFFKDKINSEIKDKFNDFITKESMFVVKKTKKNESLLDIKPYIFDYSVQEDYVFLRLKCGSVNNTKPELVIKAFCEFIGIDFNELDYSFRRVDLLTNSDNGFISLDDVGI